MANQQTAKYTIIVTLVMCIVASILVAGSVVLLRPHQEANKSLDFKRNVLSIAGILDNSKSIEDQFKSIEVKMVDLEAGRFTDAVPNVDGYNGRSVAKDPSRSRQLSGEEDLAKLGRRENYSQVFLVKDDAGELKSIILPVRGYGLWSTMMGFIALDKDLNTIVGFGFYEHSETPGLGGEIDNPRWKAQWLGKKIYSPSGDVNVQVVKGHVDPASAGAEFKADGLAGATLTSNGVDNLLKFWMGEKGFKPFLNNLKNGEA